MKVSLGLNNGRVVSRPIRQNVQYNIKRTFAYYCDKKLVIRPTKKGSLTRQKVLCIKKKVCYKENSTLRKKSSLQQQKDC